MDINIICHDILGYISKNRWVMTKEFEQDVYKPLGYKLYSIGNLKNVLPQYETKELKFAIDLLANNNHVDNLNADDWLQIQVGCFESGEQAYEMKYYIKLRDELKIKKNEIWQKKYWLIIAIFSFIMGSIFAPLIIELLKRHLWP
jgi:hypothetical protein